MQKTRKGLGRGLSALIPDADMEFLTRVARGEGSSAQLTMPLKGKGKRVKSSITPAKPVDTTAPETVPTGAQTGSAASTTAVANSPAGTIAESTSATAAGSLSPAHASDSPQETRGLAALAELVPLSQIEANPYQPRRNFSPEEMQELIDSVKEHGVLQPILLRPVEVPSEKDTSEAESGSADGTLRYQLVAGERRWRASQAAGLEVIPAIIRRVSDQQALELAVIENVQRHDISALDAALAYRRLVEEFSLSQEEVARRVGKSRVSIANTLRLLDLPVEVQKAIEEGILSEGHGRAILLAPGDGARRAVFRQAIREKLSVRSTEELARKTQGEDEAGSKNDDDALPATARLQPEIRRIEEGLQKHLGTRVRLRPRKRGGQMVIQYFSNEELERLLKLLLAK